MNSLSDHVAAGSGDGRRRSDVKVSAVVVKEEDSRARRDIGGGRGLCSRRSPPLGGNDTAYEDVATPGAAATPFASTRSKERSPVRRELPR